MLGGGRLGEGEEGLAGGPQVLDLRVESVEACGEFLDPGPGLPGLGRQFLFVQVDTFQDRLDLRVLGHASRQAGVVPVSRRAITAVIAQYTRDSELAVRCS